MYHQLYITARSAFLDCIMAINLMVNETGQLAVQASTLRIIQNLCVCLLTQIVFRVSMTPIMAHIRRKLSLTQGNSYNI